MIYIYRIIHECIHRRSCCHLIQNAIWLHDIVDPNIRVSPKEIKQEKYLALYRDYGRMKLSLTERIKFVICASPEGWDSHAGDRRRKNRSDAQQLWRLSWCVKMRQGRVEPLQKKHSIMREGNGDSENSSFSAYPLLIWNDVCKQPESISCGIRRRIISRLWDLCLDIDDIINSGNCKNSGMYVKVWYWHRYFYFIE